ncbi:MAG: hypothetical protein JXR70_02665 [Spirochaetales bacterium]|nr:hypothetical protein [Spirochaetales bacterium]
MKNLNLKFKIGFILIIFLFCAGTGFAAECGDVDASGVVNIVDALLIAQNYVGTAVESFDAAMADVNGDEAINIVDALLVAQFYVGLIDELPGCGGVIVNPDEYDCTYIPEWSATEIYQPGSQVKQLDNVYENNWYTENQEPAENSGANEVWSLMGPCDPDPEPGTPTPVPSAIPTEEPTGTPDPDRTQAPYPEMDASECGAWVMKDNVCTARYCSDNLKSEDCEGCGGNEGALCEVVSSKASVSGAWPEVTSISDEEPWHYSRSTHYGIGKGGACAFGLYNICSSAMGPDDHFFNPECEAFCRDYPDLCADPEGVTFRGNWVAPQGNYYTQFWPTLAGDWDNYLSCGECFEMIRIHPDGTEYQPGDAGYTDPIIVTVADSCPCSANSKWCCGAGRNHCYEVADYAYGCPMPPNPPLPADRDPSPEESIHIDLCSIAMARLQSGDASGGIIDGIIPTKYRRVPCPVVGNIHVWLLTGSSTWYFALSVVNVAGLGSVVTVEAQMGNGEWVSLKRDPNYTSARPQERYGTWVVPPGAGPFYLPVSLRFTNASGATLESEGAIESWKPDDEAMAEKYFIDTGVQF